MNKKTSLWGMTVALSLVVGTFTACGQTGTEKAGAPQATEPTQSATRAPQAAQKPQQAQPMTEEERTQRLLKAIWWNADSMITELKLTETQRTQLDALLTDYLSRLRAARDERKVLHDQINAAAQNAEWTKADEIAEQIAQREASTSRTQTGFRLRGLKLLTPDQLKTITEKYPHLVENPWVRFGAIRRAQQRRAAS